MTNNHAVDREEVMAFLDGELAIERAAEVEAHIKACGECRALADDMREVSGRLKRWSVEPVPTGLAPRNRPAQWLRARTRFGVPHWVMVTAPAAVLLIAVLAQPVYRYRSDGSVTVNGVTYPPPMGSHTEDKPEAVSGAAAPSAGPVGNVGRMGRQGNQGQQGRGAATVREPSTGPMVARAVSLTIVTDRFADARATLERISADMRGMVSSLRMTGDPPARRSLQATVRLPADRLDAALIEVRKLGQVRQESQSSEDVSSAHRDLVVRIGNAVKEEARLNDLLVNRTGRLQDVLAVEQEVTRVRGQIEQMKAEEIATRNRVTYATIAVDITETYRAEATLGPLPIGGRLRNALVEGWKLAANTALDLVLLILQAGPSAVLWMVILGLPAWWVWRRARRTV